MHFWAEKSEKNSVLHTHNLDRISADSFHSCQVVLLVWFMPGTHNDSIGRVEVVVFHWWAL